MREIVLPNGVLDITEGAIVHQVNCQNKFGAGLAKAIAEKYPIVKTKYHTICQAFDKDALLGTYQIVPVSDMLIIINLFSQFYYGNARRTGTVYTDYNALIHGLQQICGQYDNVYIPKGVGCGLAGGDWSHVSSRLDHLPLTAVALP